MLRTSLILISFFTITSQLGFADESSLENLDRKDSNSQTLILPSFTDPENQIQKDAKTPIQEASKRTVASCKFLGKVFGKVIGGDGNSMPKFQLRELLKKDTIKKARELGGTHLVWGETDTTLTHFRLPAEVYFCSQTEKANVRPDEETASQRN